MPTSGYLSQSLRRPLPTKDDGILRTVADAAGYMMALSAARFRRRFRDGDAVDRLAFHGGFP